MYYVGGLSYIVEHEYEEPEKDFSPKVQSVLLISGPAPVVNKGGWNDAKYVTLMQFTGLKDKNGREIYEGDYMGFNGLIFYQIAWNEKDACFDLLNTNGTLSADFDFCSYEVLGNIYENSELLNK